MITLLKVGKTTKAHFPLETVGEALLIDLGDATTLGTYPDIEAARAAAQRQIVAEPLESFCIRVSSADESKPDRLIHWTFDLTAVHRKERRQHWRIARRTAPLLLLAVWGILALSSLPPFGATTLILTGISVLIYLFAMTGFNAIEAFVIWMIMTILLTLGVPTFHKIQAQGQQALEAKATPIAP